MIATLVCRLRPPCLHPSQGNSASRAKAIAHPTSNSTTTRMPVLPVLPELLQPSIIMCKEDHVDRVSSIGQPYPLLCLA